MKNIAAYIDHTLLKPTALPEDIEKLCKEAMRYHFYAVCINGCYVKIAKEWLKNSEVKLAAVVGFPLGQNTITTKIFEAQEAIENGADEIDMVINIPALKTKNDDFLLDEIGTIKASIGKKVLKVIFENCYLETAEIIRACEIAVDAGADFVKTSTGFGTFGATEEQVALMLKTVNKRAKVKAAGGIKNVEEAEKYIKMGVERLGTSSGIAIIEGLKVEGY